MDIFKTTHEVLDVNPETLFHRYKSLKAPCPNCGGVVWFGTNYQPGGVVLGDSVRCATCQAEWTEDDDVPVGFRTPGGDYWNVHRPPKSG